MHGTLDSSSLIRLRLDTLRAALCKESSVRLEPMLIILNQLIHVLIE